MGLENINLSTSIPLTQNTEGMAAASSGAPGNPLLFLQQLLAQLQSLAGGEGGGLPTDLQAMLKNGQSGENADGQGAMDALKAALAALQAGKGQSQAESGKGLPVDDAAAGSVLPEDLESEKLDKASDKDKNLSPPLSADGLALPIPAPPIFVSPSPTPKPDFSLSLGWSAKPPADSANTAVLQGLINRGAAPVRLHQPTALMEDLEASAAKRVSLAGGANAAPAELANDADNLGAVKEEGFVNTLASVAAGGGVNPFAATEARASGATAPPAVAIPVGQPGWHQELGDRVVWMTGKSLDSASIHLNPPHLGPVEVRISMNHDQQASIQFLSEHAAVREAIEAAIPRLREMMVGQQLNLVDVNVSNQSPQQQSAQRDDGRSQNPQQSAFTMPGQEPEVDEASLADAQRVVRTSNGVLSLYA